MVLKERDGELLDTGTTYITFNGNTVKTIMNEKSVETGHFTLDASTSPGQYAFTIAADSDENGRTFHGIYRIKGDTFETCVNITPDGKRPTRFCTESDSGNQLIVWRKFGSVLDKTP